MLNTSSLTLELDVPGGALKRYVGWKTTTEVCGMHALFSAGAALPVLSMLYAMLSNWIMSSGLPLPDEDSK